jgi:tRNA modification GTPase
LCETSALSGEGIEGLVRAIGARLGAAPETIEGALVTNTRHIDLLRRCAAAFARAQATQEARGGQAPEEVLLVDLNDAREALDEIAGRRTSEDVLERIFERFCIGK